MPFQVDIDPEARLVTTRLGDLVSDAMLLEYQRTVWADPEIHGFGEIVDARGVKEIHVTSQGLRDLATTAAGMDVPGRHTRLAIIADSPLTFGLARMYQSFRELEHGNGRDVQVCKDPDEARAFALGASGG